LKGVFANIYNSYRIDKLCRGDSLGSNPGRVTFRPTIPEEVHRRGRKW